MILEDPRLETEEAKLSFVVFCFLVEGFFCQTTTSEERDLGLGSLGPTELVVPRVHKESLSLDDSTGHYISQSAHESDEDIARFVDRWFYFVR